MYDQATVIEKERKKKKKKTSSTYSFIPLTQLLWTAVSSSQSVSSPVTWPCSQPPELQKPPTIFKSSGQAHSAHCLASASFWANVTALPGVLKTTHPFLRCSLFHTHFSSFNYYTRFCTAQRIAPTQIGTCLRLQEPQKSGIGGDRLKWTNQYFLPFLTFNCCSQYTYIHI